MHRTWVHNYKTHTMQCMVFDLGTECNATPRPARVRHPWALASLATCRMTYEARSHATAEILFSSASQGLDFSLQPWKAFQTRWTSHFAALRADVRDRGALDLPPRPCWECPWLLGC